MATRRVRQAQSAYAPPPYLASLLLALVLILSFAVKMSILLQTPHFAGIDSGYYVWHVNEILGGGQYLSEPPLVFYVSAFFALLFGGDAMLGVKVTLALFSTLVAVPFFLIVRDATKNAYVGVAAAFLGAFAASNWWISVGHVKNIAGLFFGLFVIYFFIKSLRGFRLRDLALLSASLLLMVGSHFSSSAYVVAALLPASLAILAYSIIRHDLPAAYTALAFLAAVFAVTVAVLILRPGLVEESSIGTLGIYDVQSQKPGYGEGPVNFSIIERYLLFYPFVVLGLVVLWRGDRNAMAVLLFWLLASLFLTQPLFMERSWLLRFEMMSFLPVMLLALVGISYFKDARIAALLLLVLAVYVLSDFASTNARGIPMPVSSEEFLGFTALHGRFPGTPVLSQDVALKYWLLGIGFEVYDRPPQNFTGAFLLVQQSQPQFQGPQPGGPAAGPPSPSQGPAPPPSPGFAPAPPSIRLPPGAAEVASIGRYVVFLVPAK